MIKLIADLGEDEGAIITESTFAKIISVLNETIEVVLDYLKDAKDHGQKKGDTLLASVRLIGSCLRRRTILNSMEPFPSFAQLKWKKKMTIWFRVRSNGLMLSCRTPLVSKDKVIELLVYMLSIEGEDEASAFSFACFLMSLMCQTTMNFEGAKILAHSGAYKAVVECLAKLFHQSRGIVEDNGCIFLACDTDATDESSVIMMGSSICALIFDTTSEEALLRYPDIGESTLSSLSRLIVRSLAAYGQEKCDDAMSDLDLQERFTAGYSRWSDKFPRIRKAVGR